MGRHLRIITPSEQAAWDRICRAWQAGTKTIDDVMTEVGMSRAYCYKRLKEAAFRIEDEALDRNQVAHDQRRETSPPVGNRASDPEIEDDTPFLALVDSPLDAVRPVRDYSGDDIHGEERFVIRDHYDLNTDRTSLDGIGGPVLVGSQAGASVIGGNSQRRSAPPLEGQRLKRWRLGGGNRAQAGARNHKPDPRGLKGGLA